MQYDVERTVWIDAPTEKVWRWIAHIDRELQWRNVDGTGLRGLERLDEGPLSVGSRFRGVVKVGPGTPEAYVNEITELDPGRRIGWRTVEAEGHLLGVGSYEVVPEGTGSRFRIRIGYPPRTFVGRLQRPVARLVGGRYLGRAVHRLKTLVEADDDPV